MPAATDWGARVEKYDFASQADARRPKSVQRLTLDPATRRAQSSIECATENASLKGDGTQTCVIAIGVTCKDGLQCAYRLRIEQ